MFCPNCGTKLPDGGRFCPNCGTDTAVPNSPAQPPVPSPVRYEPGPVPAAPKKKKTNKGLIIGVSVASGVLVLLIAVAVVLFLLLGGGKTPTMTYKGMTFSYGMEIDLDKLERKFPEMEVVGRDTYWLDDDVGLFLREDRETGKLTLAYFALTGESSAKINGVSVGDSERSFCAAFPQAEHPTDMIGGTVHENQYIYYLWKGKTFSYAEYQDQMMAYRLEGNELAANSMRLEALMVQAYVEDGEVIRIIFGDTMALTMMR